MLSMHPDSPFLSFHVGTYSVRITGKGDGNRPTNESATKVLDPEGCFFYRHCRLKRALLLGSIIGLQISLLEDFYKTVQSCIKITEFIPG